MRNLLLAAAAVAVTVPSVAEAVIIRVANPNNLETTNGSLAYRTNIIPASQQQRFNPNGSPVNTGTAFGRTVNCSRFKAAPASGNDFNTNTGGLSVTGLTTGGNFLNPGDSTLNATVDVGSVTNLRRQPGTTNNCYLAIDSQVLTAGTPAYRAREATRRTVVPVNTRSFGFFWGSMDQYQLFIPELGTQTEEDENGDFSVTSYNWLQFFPQVGGVVSTTPINPRPVCATFANPNAGRNCNTQGTPVYGGPTGFTVNELLDLAYVSGAEIAAALGLPLYGDYFIELVFTANELQTYVNLGGGDGAGGARLGMRTTNTNWELDNVYLTTDRNVPAPTNRVGIFQVVPAPASVAVLGLGLALVAASRRRRA